MRSFYFVLFPLFSLFLFMGVNIISAQESAPTSSSESVSESHDADWLREAQIGVFTHFLPGNEVQFALLEKYDVQAVARQMHELGVKYFVFTIYQNSGFLNAPNQVYDEITGYVPGQKCSKRDVPMELADALAVYNIRLILYVTGQTPNRDVNAQAKFGLSPEAKKDLKLDLEFARKYAQVFQCWSDRYGEKVAGWWVDGCYAHCEFNEEIAQIYSAALKHGNPNAIVAFNSGVLRPEWQTSDYTSGEIMFPFRETVSSPCTESGQQRQILTYLGNSWAQPNCRFTLEEWVHWVQSVVSGGGVVTLDAAPNRDPAAGPIGTLNEAQAAWIKAIRARVK